MNNPDRVCNTRPAGVQKDFIMWLIKHCEKQHNILRGADLQLGTLNYYRSIENDELSDEGEGLFDFDLVFQSDAFLERKLANLLFQGQMVFGDMSDIPRIPGGVAVDIKDARIHHRNDGILVKNGSTIRIHRNAPNCYILCMSATDDIQSSPFEEYNDKWLLPLEKANDFAESLAKELFQMAQHQQLSRNWNGNPSQVPTELIKFNFHHQHVLHRDRKQIIKHSNDITFDGLYDILLSIPFIKPKNKPDGGSYSDENEYRFVFNLYSESDVFEPSTSSMRLCMDPSSPILRHVILKPDGSAT